MGWLEKFDVIRELVNEDPSLWDLCDLHDPASDEFIEKVATTLPFADKEYLGFLRYTDGCRIDSYFIFGSGAAHFIPDDVFHKESFQCPSLFDEVLKLNQELPKWRATADLEPFLPISRSLSGDVYCLMLADGRILEIDCETKRVAYDQILAISFGEYLDKVLMGDQYYLLGVDDPNDWDPDNENDWTRFLNDQGWWPITKER